MDAAGWDEGIMPDRGTAVAACYDIYMPAKGCIKAGKIAKIPLNIGFEIPEGHHIEIHSRSSTFGKRGMVIIPTIVDEDYRGIVHAMILNPSDEDMYFARGERLVQFKLVKTILPDEIIQVDQLSPTERGEAGCGSTGL